MAQVEAIWDATHIGDRQDQDNNILLYQLDSFYVEVYYHMEYNVIRNFRSFSNTEQLLPYLRQIDINEYLK